MKEVAEESMKMAAVEENSSSPDNLLTVSGDSTWKTRGHSSLIGVCTVIGAKQVVVAIVHLIVPDRGPQNSSWQRTRLYSGR
ncbi:hypothetical protein TNCV_2993211 [Trichonephila clavipes]|nr:hypothetical protein TNCV_2993211 [Trichonephila clavipes]